MAQTSLRCFGRWGADDRVGRQTHLCDDRRVPWIAARGGRVVNRRDERLPLLTSPVLRQQLGQDLLRIQGGCRDAGEWEGEGSLRLARVLARPAWARVRHAPGMSMCSTSDGLETAGGSKRKEPNSRTPASRSRRRTAGSRSSCLRAKSASAHGEAALSARQRCQRGGRASRASHRGWVAATDTEGGGSA